MNELGSTFAESEQALRTLLHSRGASSNIVWVFANDIAILRRRIYIAPHLGTNAIVRQIFLRPQVSDFGIELRAICSSNMATICTPVVPMSVRQAQELRIEGLKLAVPHHLPKYTDVCSALWWTILRAVATDGRAIDVMPPPEQEPPPEK